MMKSIILILSFIAIVAIASPYSQVQTSDGKSTIIKHIIIIAI